MAENIQYLLSQKLTLETPCMNVNHRLIDSLPILVIIIYFI